MSLDGGGPLKVFEPGEREGQCRAPRKDGLQCTMSARRANIFCHRHAMKHGTIQAAEKTEGWTRYDTLTGPLAAGFKKALAANDLLDMKPDLAMMDAQIEKALESASSMDTPAWRDKVKRKMVKAKNLLNSHKVDDARVAMTELESLVERGSDQLQLVDRVFDMVDRRAERLRRIRETQIREDQVVTMRDMALIFAAWVDVLEREIAPEDFLRIIPTLQEVSGMRSSATLPVVDADEAEFTELGPGGEDGTPEGD